MTTHRFPHCLLAATIVLLLGCGKAVYAQQSNFNEWYDAQSQYIKVKVHQDGIYRITNSHLHSVGAHDLANLRGSNLRVYYRGIEVPVSVQDSVSGALAYFDFVGFRNDGAIDSLLYRNANPPFRNDPSRQPNLHTSFYSDTAAYFVTWDNPGTARLQTIFPQNFGGYSPESAYRYQIRREYTEDFFEGGGGSFDINNVLNPDWVTGEGFLSREINPNDNPDRLSSRLYTWGHAQNGSPNHVEARIVTVNNAPLHVAAIDIDLQDRFMDTLEAIEIKTVAFDFVENLDSNVFIRFHARGSSTGVVDKQRIAWCTVEYDRTFDLHDSSATVLQHYLHTDTTYLQFYNADVNAEAYLIDVAHQLRIVGQVSGDTLRFLVPGSPDVRTLRLYTDKAIQTPMIDVSPGFGNVTGDPNGAEFVIITDKKFSNSALAYAAYRDSTTINRLTARVVYIDEIYNEFGYGTMTPVAIKNFCRYTLENWPTKPKHFMLWGKGRNCPKYTCDPLDNYIPTWGTPANDLEYVTNFERETHDLVPKAGMGRVSVRDDAQGLVYLEKVREYEHQAYAPWITDALFMGGGNTDGQQAQIKSYLVGDTATNGVISVEGFNAYWEGEPLLGEVWSYQKRGNGFVSNTSMTTEERINAGVGLLQYFGHSAVNVFELDLLEPSRYQNVGKYPVMLAFGCSGGNFNEHRSSYGERFIFEPHKGGIAYVGNTTAGWLQQLGQYGQHWYPNAFRTQYGRSLGEIFTHALDSFCSNPTLLTYENIYAASHAKQMNLQGDPSIAMNLPTKADLRVGTEDIYFPTGFPGALDPHFQLNVILHNDGRSFEDSFNVVVTHRLPTGSMVAWIDTIRVGPFWNADTLQLEVPNTQGLGSAGYNTIEVLIDPEFRIDEHYETNNATSVQQLFVGTIANPILPPEYQIVPHSTIALIASTYQMLPSGPIRYTFEIDTTADFDSPFKKTSPVVVGNSAMAEWPIPFAMTPGQVYYWRSRLTDFYPAQWSSSSFKYVPGQNGWSQSQIPQFLKDAGDGIHLDAINQEWTFERWEAELHAYILSTGSPGKAVYFFGAYSSENDADNGIYYTPIDGKTLQPKFTETPKGDWRFLRIDGSPNPGSEVEIPITIAEMEDGDYFLLVSNGNPSMHLWSDNVLQAFEEVGGNFGPLRAIPDGDRLIFWGRKGSAPGSATLIARPNLEVTGQAPMHDLNKTVSAPTGAGTVTSTLIGPARSWSSMNFDWRAIEPNSPDTSYVEIYGVRKDQSMKRLLTQYHGSTRQLSDIPADSFPYLRLVDQARDKVLYTAPQLQKWEVYYQTVADLAFDANLALIVPDTIVEGALAHLRFMVRNLTSEPMDSVLVRYALQAADRSVVPLGEYRYKGFEAREVRQFNQAFQTGAIGLKEGAYTLIVEVNPAEDQPELHHFNNFYFHRIWVAVDEVGPLVDVTIDGKHMMSGDLVSPEPEIVIQINDDNAYLPVVVSDSTYRIWFGTERSYRTNPMVRIEDNDSVEKVPVRMPENKSRLIFRPGRLTDGEYTLAVQGYDATGNEAGGKPYTIQINVVSTKAMSEVLPYPNPFSSACHFAYTLTGDEKPSRFDIEIYTITGKLVKVVDLLELGDVHFGRNLTDYAWDGRDEYGDQLANGVYLYRVRTQFQDGSKLNLRDEGVSQYFNNGFGKMYLMR